MKSSILQLDRQPRLIRVRMQWYYLHLLLPSPKYRHYPKDAYFLVRERAVRSVDLVSKDISYIPSRKGGCILTHIILFILFICVTVHGKTLI